MMVGTGFETAASGLMEAGHHQNLSGIEALLPQSQTPILPLLFFGSRARRLQVHRLWVGLNVEAENGSMAKIALISDLDEEGSREWTSIATEQAPN